MPISLIKPSFSAGELSPSLWGRVDYRAWHIGASVMRNVFVSYRGGASSRAGTAWVCQSLTPAGASSTSPRILRFQFNIFQSYILEFGQAADGRSYMRVIANGASVTEAPQNITAITQANPAQVTVPNHGYVNGDWVFISAVQGMTQLNVRTFVVANVTTNTFALQDTFGNPVNSLAYAAYTGGGTAARIYTNYNSPYDVEDLPYLKVVQSADVMSLCCVNQDTGTEYPPYDLARLAANNWTFTQTTFASAIAAPTGCTAATSATASPPTQYAYVVTAVDAATGEESVASNVANITNSVNIALTAGAHTISWNEVQGAAYYNVYQAPPSYNTAVPVGSVFAYVGFSYGTQFVNSNILADQTITPPLHNNPFARGQITGVTLGSGGTGYTQATVGVSIGTATGSGAVIVPIAVSGAIVGFIVQNPGQNYATTDTITITDSGTGAGATATLQIGPQSGTYPSVVDYFQQRRVYAGPLNNPDTLYFSQTGAYQNMDAATPPIDSDAIVTTPWGQQVNGIQWLQPMPGGLITATGLDAWQLSGAGGAGSPLTPASQSAQAQESNGFSPTVKPIKINGDIIYNQSLGYVIRDIQFNFVTNIYAGNDLSLLSNHLFDGFEIVQWAWAQVPYKIVWATRDDGKFLSLTFDKEEQLQGWARHDTNGIVVGNEVATEPPVSAPYFVVKRYISGVRQWAYYIERMDNRLWQGPEDPWCVDAGLALDMPMPDATLSASAAEGLGDISGAYLATGGQNYTNPSVAINDPSGAGSGAVITVSQTGGVIDGVTVVSGGQGYSAGTTLTVNDPTGAGATLVPFVSQNVTFMASQSVFDSDQVGDIIRIGGGQAEVKQVINANEVLAAITVPILDTIPNDPNRTPVPAPPGKWSITTPVSSITNLYHLEGMQVTGLADGAVISLTTVQNGTIDLPEPASSVKIGLPFIAQIQAMPIEIQGMGTVQGKRKTPSSANIIMEKSKGVQVGADRPVASTLDYQPEVPWTDLVDLPEVPSVGFPEAALPLFTGIKYANLNADWQSWNGWEAAGAMIAAQQTQPLPMNILAFAPDVSIGK